MSVFCDGIIYSIAVPLSPVLILTALVAHVLPSVRALTVLLNCFSGAQFPPLGHSLCFSKCHFIHYKSSSPLSASLLFWLMLLCQFSACFLKTITQSGLLTCWTLTSLLSILVIHSIWVTLGKRTDHTVVSSVYIWVTGFSIGMWYSGKIKAQWDVTVHYLI